MVSEPVTLVSDEVFTVFTIRGYREQWHRTK